MLRYVRRTGEPLVVADATADDRFARDPYLAGADCCALLAVPILSRSSLRAVLLLENRLLRGAFTADRLDAVTLIAGQLAVSLDNAQLYQQLTTSRARIVAAADQARRRIERDLHDGAQQRLVSLALQLRGVQAEVPPEAGDLSGPRSSPPPKPPPRWRSCRRSPAACTPQRWPTAACPGPELTRPPLPRPGPPGAAPDRRLPDPIELAAYYAVAEALTNTAKYAHASVVTVLVVTDDDVLQISVRDDGCGGADLARGTGLLGLKDRIEALDGRITVHSPPGAGTTLRAELPAHRHRRRHGALAAGPALLQPGALAGRRRPRQHPVRARPGIGTPEDRPPSETAGQTTEAGWGLTPTTGGS